MLNFNLSENQRNILNSLEKILLNFNDDYWSNCDKNKTFPNEFYDIMATHGWLGITMPKEYGGIGLGITEAALMMMNVAKIGGMSAASSIHMNIFAPKSIEKFAKEEERSLWLPEIIKGKKKLCFAVTEADAGLNTTAIKTEAKLIGKHYYLKGSKIWTSTAQVADKIMILARTTKYNKKNPTSGLSLFYTDYNRKYIETSIINKMGRDSVDSNILYFENLRIPKNHLIGSEGNGFKYILQSLNPERILIAAESIGLAENVLYKATDYSKNRIVFNRPIGQNQSIQHPLAKTYINIEACKLLTLKAATLYDKGIDCSIESNAAKYLSAETGLEACKTSISTHGGMGYAKDYHVERLFREMLIPYLAPISQQLVLCYIAEKALGLPKSY